MQIAGDLAGRKIVSLSDNRHFGVHLTVDGYRASRSKLADQGFLADFLFALPGKLGMHRIAEPLIVEVGPQNRKDPGGISGVVLIAESHISLHTFPLRGFLSADVYTCQNELDEEAIVAQFRGAFDMKDVETHLIRRGLNYPEHDIYEADCEAVAV